MFDNQPGMDKILPVARSGFYYEDRWISPYLRVEFQLPAGQPFLEFDVYNPQHEEFAGASFLVRLGLTPLYRSEPMGREHRQWHTIKLPPMAESGVVSIAFRSSVRWRAPEPDKRLLGLMLPALYCSMRPDRADPDIVPSAAETASSDAPPPAPQRQRRKRR